DLSQMGFNLVATDGTAKLLRDVNIPASVMNKVSEGSPHIVDAIRAGDIHLIINTPRGGQAHYDGALIRGTAALYGVPIITTMSAATAAVQGIKALRQKPLKARSLQVHHQQMA
ncbi:MAG: carbamoyl phosphate synthase large subunit, partial [Anaerolineae bacterium]